MHRVTGNSRTGRQMNSRVSSARSMFMPHEGAKQNAKAQFAYSQDGNKLKGARWSNALERVVFS